MFKFEFDRANHGMQVFYELNFFDYVLKKCNSKFILSRKYWITTVFVLKKLVRKIRQPDSLFS
jgi:hypothetical protein